MWSKVRGDVHPKIRMRRGIVVFWLLLQVLLVGSGTALGQDAGPPAELEPPAVETLVQATYPEAARAEGVEGVVVLEILVDATGHSA